MRKKGSFTICSPVPGHKRRDLTRTVHDVPTVPMHEVLANELRDSAPVPFKLEEAREHRTLPRACCDRPIGKASSTLCVASGGFHGRRRLQPQRYRAGRVGAINMISQKRHVVALIRKWQMCKCGCQGWCSQFPLLTFLRWSLKAIADRRFVWRAYRHFSPILFEGLSGKNKSL